jgi:outer membrane protein TolC
MQRIRKRRTLWAALISTVLASAAQADSGTVTLAEVVRSAQLDPPRVLFALASVQRREAERQVASASYLPTLSAQGTATLAYQNQEVGGGIRNNFASDNYGGSVNMDWSIVNVARRKGVASAGAAYRSEQENLADIRRQAVAAAIELFVRALSTSTLIDDAQLTLERRSQQLSAIQGLVRAGLRPSVDETRAQVEAVAARYRLDVRRLEQRAAYAALASSLGRDPTQGVRPANTSSEAFKAPSSIDDALRLATDQRADVRKLELQLKARQFDVQTAVLRRLPTLGLSASGSASYVDRIEPWTATIPGTSVKSGYQGDQYNASGQLYLRWGGLDASVIRTADVARGAMLEAQRMLEAALLDLRAQVVDAVIAVERAQKELERATEMLQAAGATREAQLGRYKAGVASLLDLLDAEQLEQNARLTRIESARDYDVARVRLLSVVGSVEQTR